MDFEQQPFTDADFADNPEPRCPCVLLLDTSGSMNGAKIEQLNRGLETFEDELRADALAVRRVELAIVTFGPVSLARSFATLDGPPLPRLDARGDTPMGAAISKALRLVEERKRAYRRAGIAYYRPWIFMITDGAPTDDVERAASAIREGEARNAFVFFAVGVDEADMDQLARIAVRSPLRLRGLAFRELFQWLSASLASVSQSQIGTKVALPPPSGWSEV